MRNVVVLPAEVIQDPKMKHFHLRVIGTLLRYADRDGKCWPSLRTIADELKANLRQVSRALKEMVSLSYVRITKRGRSNQYHLAKRFLAHIAPARPTATVDSSGTDSGLLRRQKGVQEPRLERIAPTESVTPIAKKKSDAGDDPSRSARPEREKALARQAWLGMIGEFVRDTVPGELEAFWQLAVAPADEARETLNRLDRLMRQSDWWRKRQQRPRRGLRQMVA